MAPIPLYPHQAVILDPPHLLRRSATLYTSTTSVPPACEELIEAFCEGICLGFMLMILLGIAYAIVCFCVWATRKILDAVASAFNKTPKAVKSGIAETLVAVDTTSNKRWPGCLCSVCTGTDDYARMTDTPSKPKFKAGLMWRLRIGSMPLEIFMTRNEKGDKSVMLSNATDLWSFVSSKEIKTWRKTNGAKNSFDRRQRSKSIGHVEQDLSTNQKASQALEACRRQIETLQASIARIPLLHPRLPSQPSQPSQPSPMLPAYQPQVLPLPSSMTQPPPRYEP
jgi:hypothetical protein